MINLKRCREEEKRYFDIENIIKFEIIQKKEEGYDTFEIENEYFKNENKDNLKYKTLLDDLQKISIKPGFPYNEPSDLYKIKAENSRRLAHLKLKTELTLTDSEIFDKIYGGWLGRCAGCLLGKPVEGLDKVSIEEWLRKADAYPLKNYFPAIDEMPERAQKRGVLLGDITHMPRDDDTDFTIIGLHILENCGKDFTTQNVGETWLNLLTYWKVHTAERAAYRNIINGIPPPESSTYMNPYREWIGAQIRADIWGYVTPGMPEIGAEIAYRDARLSHVKNGIYGEMFVSAMISAAFTTNKIDRVIETGLSVIPTKSRLSEAVNKVVNWSKEYADWEDTWNKIMHEYKDHHWIHLFSAWKSSPISLFHSEFPVFL